MEPLVFINIGWMKRYQGPSPTDELEPGNFGYFKKNKSRKAVGHEQRNFVDRDGWVYGYVPRSSGINITRLGANKDQDELEGVLVIFVARDPAAQELKVVGWYRNATVSRSIKFSRRFGRVEVETPIAALASGSYVLPAARRDVIVPTAQKSPGGFGQHEAAALTGGGHNAFSRYERGEAEPVVAVVNLFRLLDKQPELLKELWRAA